MSENAIIDKTSESFKYIDGNYNGEIKKGTRIRHGRGIFIKKSK